MLGEERTVAQAQSEGTDEREEEREVVERRAGDERGEGRGQERGTREEQEGRSDRHRKSGWDPKWLELPRFKSFIYNTPNGEFKIQSVLPSLIIFRQVLLHFFT